MSIFKNTGQFWLMMLSILFLSSCSQPFTIKPFKIEQLAKGDIDFVADIHRAEITSLLTTLMTKLYKRNPKELYKVPGATIEKRIQTLFALIVEEQPLIIEGRGDIDILTLAFDVDYAGDRVFLLMAGIASMIHKSYEYRQDFYLFDTLDQQKLYDSARNIEVISWRLRVTTDEQGDMLLLSNALEDNVINLSFERILSKLIVIQDMMALITADGNRRAINKVAHSVASMVFIPL